MKRAMAETDRRRGKQVSYNEEHGIEPATIIKAIDSDLVKMANLDYLDVPLPGQKSKLDIAGGEDIDKAGNFGPLRAHLRSVYASAPLAKQKLLAQLETTSRIMSRYMDQLKGDQDRVSLDIVKVKDLLGHRHVTTTQIYDKRRRSVAESASHDLPRHLRQHP